jgi:hypothetical protein
MNRRVRDAAIVLTVFCMAALCLAQETPKAGETPQAKAWSVLNTGLAESNTGKRTTSGTGPGLLPGDVEAKDAALKALMGISRQQSQSCVPAVRLPSPTSLGPCC